MSVIREIALYVGYVALAGGAVAGAIFLVGAAWWWAAEQALEQWTSMTLFWQTVAEINRKKKRVTS